jgi:hypothetical protein
MPGEERTGGPQLPSSLLGLVLTLILCGVLFFVVLVLDGKVP